MEYELNTVSDLRKGMIKIRNGSQEEKKSNEYENVLRIDDLLKKEKKKKSIWKKHILKLEENNWLYDNSGRKTMIIHSNLSILGILESAAKDKVKLRQSSLY